jgi:hypothetical protein
VSEQKYDRPAQPSAGRRGISDPLPCAFCDRPDAVKTEVDREGTLWGLCQIAEDGIDLDDCHWTDHGPADTFCAGSPACGCRYCQGRRREEKRDE